MMLFRFMRVSLVAAVASLFLMTGMSQGQKTGRDPALGRWKMDVKKSRFLDPKDRIVGMTRVYSADGEMTKVWWESHPASGKPSSHSFSAKCDGTEETAYDQVKVQCTYKNRSWVDGEWIDESDPGHRYFSQVVAPDSKTMKIIWFSDPERKRLKDVLQFDRAEESRKK